MKKQIQPANDEVRKDISKKYDRQLRRIGGELFRGILAYQIEVGEIDPREKSDEEIVQLVAEKVQKAGGFRWSIDHTNNLLTRARAAAKTGDYEFACLFYALWLEHYLNRLVHVASIRHGFSEKEAEVLIRETNLRSKLLWLHLALRKSPPPRAYVTKLGQISERRNQFVHYKWRLRDVDAPDKGYEDAVEGIEKIVRHLRSFESSYIYNKQKHRLNVLEPRRSRLALAVDGKKRISKNPR